MIAFIRGLIIILVSGLVFGTASAPTAFAQSAPVSVTIESLTVSSATVAPGQTVTFTAVLMANQTVSGYPVEFSWVAPGATNGTNAGVGVNYTANTSVTATASWTVPSTAATGTYKLILNAYNPSWSVPAMANASTEFTVGPEPGSGSGSTTEPLSVSVNSLTVQPAVAEPGQTITITAALTANQTVSGYPLEFNIAEIGAHGVNQVVRTNYVAGQRVIASTNWTVPAGTPPGTFKVLFHAFDPAWNVPALAKSTTSFAVGTPSSAAMPGPSAALFAAPFYTCLRNFYVATTGNDSNPGTQASPWLTIQHADTTSRQGGDCINVAPGLYQAHVLIQHGGTAPAPSGYVAYRCQVLDACHVLAPGGGHLWGFAGGGNFVAVDGFEVDGNNALLRDGVADACFGSDGATYGTGNSSHHLWILNNIIHHCNLSGISFNNKEWYYALQNTVYHNSWTSGYQGSGISFVVPQCIESGNSSCASGNTFAGGTGTYVPSGMDLTYMPPFHNVVSGNVVYNNMIAPDNPVPCGAHTDGNGIIMDTFLDQATNSIVYPYQTLVTQNVSYANGGRGIHVFRSSNVTVANNTVFGNGTDTCINAYVLGDLSQQGGSNDVWINNISQSVYSPANPSCGSYCGNRNFPFVAGDGGGIADRDNTYADNITYGGYGVALFNADTSYFSCANNKCNTNPMLMSPATANFALQSDSPAIGYGQLQSYLPSSATTGGACPGIAETCP
jgi:parallel beta-helix repeat protein